MKLVVPKEITFGENRVGVTPDSMRASNSAGATAFSTISSTPASPVYPVLHIKPLRPSNSISA